MKLCTIKVSTKDGVVRRYEGSMLFVSYSSTGMCNILDESGYDDKIIDRFSRDEIAEMEIHMKEVDSGEQR